MTESDDQLGSLFFYMLVVYPVVSWILHPGRFSKRKAITYAVLFLAAIATAHVVYDLRDKGMNYYRVLGVARASPPSVIKKAFKRLSLELHPDKNSSPFAHEQFQLVKHAHDVLMNPDLRSGYDKFGEEGVQIATQVVLDNKQVLIRLLVSYISQAIFSFIMTASEPSGDALKVTFLGLLIMSIIEGGMVFGQLTLPAWLLPQVAPFEAIWVLHRIFPAFMNGCRAVCGAIYVDQDSVASRFVLRIASESTGITQAAVDALRSLYQPSKVADQQVESGGWTASESLLQRCNREHRSRPTDPAISVECAQITSQTQQALQLAATHAKGKTVADGLRAVQKLEERDDRQSFWTFVGSIAVYLVAHYACSKILVGVEEGGQ